jgi:hypothetical protein
MSVEPYLFSADASLVAAACDEHRPPEEQAPAVVVDWERLGKAERQVRAEERIGTGTQIAADTEEDLRRVRAAVRATVICRINQPGPWTRHEVERAVALGADEVLVPMVRRPADVHAVLRAAAGRVGVGIQIETVDAVHCAGRLGRLPVARVYVGLMDLALERGTPSIFTALVDGTVERVRGAVPAPFGFGGLTVPGAGRPLPTDLLLGEMTRLSCAFTFLRRSFIADVGQGGIDAGTGLAAVRRAARAAGQRSSREVQHDRLALVAAVRGLDARRLVAHGDVRTS